MTAVFNQLQGPGLAGVCPHPWPGEAANKGN